MKKRLLYCMLCVLALGAAVGCGNQAQRVETDEEIRNPDDTEEETLGENADLYEAVEQENKKQTGETVLSEDGLHQVVIPSGWQQCSDKINETMLFELQGETEDQYMGILVLSDAAYGEFDLAAYMEVYEDNMREQFENAIMGETMPVEVNGNPAYSLKVTGSVNEMEYINHIYAVDYEGEKVIFTASTYQENEGRVTRDLEEVVYSFTQIPAE